MNVAKRTPHAREIAMGKNGPVAGVTVVIKGIRPTNVVTEVSRIGLNRRTQAFVIASISPVPSRRSRLA